MKEGANYTKGGANYTKVGTNYVKEGANYMKEGANYIWESHPKFIKSNNNELLLYRQINNSSAKMKRKI